MLEELLNYGRKAVLRGRLEAEGLGLLFAGDVPASQLVRHELARRLDLAPLLLSARILKRNPEAGTIFPSEDSITVSCHVSYLSFLHAQGRAIFEPSLGGHSTNCRTFASLGQRPRT